MEKWLVVAMVAAVAVAILVALLRAVFRLVFGEPRPAHWSPPIGLDELPSFAALAGNGLFQVVVVRQSGNDHAVYQVATAPAALAKAMGTFKRAKIDDVVVTRNTTTELYFQRMFHSHRGSSEGRKVGAVEITRMS